MARMDDATRDEVDRLRLARQDTLISVRKSCDEFREVFIRGYFSDPHNLELIRSMKGNFCAGSGRALRNAAVVGTHTMASIENYEFRNRLQHIDLPVLVITGTDDIFPAEAMIEWEAALPNARLVLLERAGHYPQIERPDEFFRIVNEFMMRP